MIRISLLLVLLIPGLLSAQQRPVNFISPGTGAAALGMGGAFVATSSDPTALYWNPAGLSLLSGFHAQIDYTYLSGNDDFVGNSNFRRIPSETYSFSRSQPQFVAVSHQWKMKEKSFGAAFGYQRLSLFGSTYELAEPVTGTFEGRLARGTYRANYRQQYEAGEDQFSFGFSGRLSERLALGVSWNFLTGNPARSYLDHTETNGFLDTTGEPYEEVSEFVYSRSEDLSGHYFKLGVLARINSLLSVGGAVRLPYGRSSILEETYTRRFIQMAPVSDVTTQSVQHTKEQRVDIPTEWTAGVEIRPTRSLMLGSSVTYANWSDVCVEEAGECVVSFPLSRRPGDQSDLFQFRFGGQYNLKSLPSLSLRAGFLLDHQPYSGDVTDFEEIHNAPFYAWSLGAGYQFQRVRFDLAFLRESGDFAYRVVSSDAAANPNIVQTDADFVNNRLLVSLSFSTE